MSLARIRNSARRLAFVPAVALLLAALGCSSGGGDNSLDLGGAGGGVAISATTGAIEARLVDANNASLNGQAVTVSGTASRQSDSLNLTADSNGVVRAGNLPPGNYTINASGVLMSLPVSANQVTTRRFNVSQPNNPQTSLGLLYVVNTLAKTLSIVDTVTGAVQNNVLSTGEAPNQVAFLNGVGYIVNSASNAVQRFNPSTHTTLGNIATGDNTNPWNLLFASNTKAYVTNLVSNEVAVINLSTNQVSSTIPVTAGPEGMAIVGNSLYVCCTNFSFATFTFDDGKLDIINTATDQVTGSVSLGVGANPQAVVQGADGMLYVVATGDFATAGTRVIRVNPTTNQVIGAPLALTGGTLVNSGGIALAPNGRAFLADSNNALLHVIDTATGTVLRTGATGLATGPNPLGVATSADGRVYVMNFGDDTVSVFDATTLAPIGSPLALGDGPLAGGGRQQGASAVSLAVR